MLDETTEVTEEELVLLEDESELTEDDKLLEESTTPGVELPILELAGAIVEEVCELAALKVAVLDRVAMDTADDIELATELMLETLDDERAALLVLVAVTLLTDVVKPDPPVESPPPPPPQPDSTRVSSSQPPHEIGLDEKGAMLPSCFIASSSRFIGIDEAY